MVFRTFSNLQATKYAPMIKFRFGSNKGGVATKAQAKGTAAAAPSKTKSSSKNATQSKGPAIEDYDLPPRYKRKPIDPTEMEYINCGGPP